MRYEIILWALLILPLLGSMAEFWLKKTSDKLREIFYILLAGVELLLVVLLYPSVMNQSIQASIPNMMGIGLHLRLDGLRYLFVFLAAWIWFLTTIYSIRYLDRKKGRYFAFAFLTFSSVMGLFLSENLLNLFTFFEIMSFASYMLVIHDETDDAHEAGRIYLAMAIGGGMVLLMGLALLYYYIGTLNISEIHNQLSNLGNVKYLISTLMLIGFGIKGCMFPLHIWAPKVYAASPIPAGALLSGVLLKTGLFGILITTAVLMRGDIVFSTVILILGLLNMLIGGFLAMFQINIKKILAYSGMSQAGYIIVGIGMMGLFSGNAVAAYGTLYHMFNHGIFKVLLFMVAGAAYVMTGEFSINRLKGWGKNQILLKIAALIGMFAIMGVPGHNGYISKILLHESLAQVHGLYPNWFFFVIESAFVIGSGFTAAYLLKVFMTVFVEEKKRSSQLDPNLHSKCILFPISCLAFLVLLIGIIPKVLFATMAEASRMLNVHALSAYPFYTAFHTKTAAIPILVGAAIYILGIRRYLCIHMEGRTDYIDTSENWINLEKHIYYPILNFLYTIGLKVFNYIDQIPAHIVSGINHSLLYFYCLSNNAFIRIVPKSNHNFKRMPKLPVKNQPFSAKVKERHKSISDIIVNCNVELSSLTYSVFIFALVLAIAFIVSFWECVDL